MTQELSSYSSYLPFGASDMHSLQPLQINQLQKGIDWKHAQLSLEHGYNITSSAQEGKDLMSLASTTCVKLKASVDNVMHGWCVMASIVRTHLYSRTLQEFLRVQKLCLGLTMTVLLTPWSLLLDGGVLLLLFQQICCWCLQSVQSLHSTLQEAPDLPN